MNNKIYSLLVLLTVITNSSIIHTQEQNRLDTITQEQINAALIESFHSIEERIDQLEKKSSETSPKTPLNKEVEYKYLQQKPIHTPCFNEEQMPFARIVTSSLALFNEMKKSDSKKLPDIEDFIVATLEGKKVEISLKSQADSPGFLDPKFYNLLWHGKYWTPNSINIQYKISQIRPGYIEATIATEGSSDSINKDQQPAHCQFSSLLKKTPNITYLVDEDMASHPDEASIQGESCGNCRGYGCDKTFRIFIEKNTFVAMVQQYNSSKYKQK